ncbi:hypothetical protein Tco_1563613 [Tanacetum coccineum]
MSIEEIISEKRLIDDEFNDITNDLSYKRFQGEKIDDEYERDCEIKIKQLLQDYSGLDIEMQKKERVLMEEKYLAASQRIKSICNDEDDSIPLRDIIARYSPSVAITSSRLVLPTREPEESLIMGDEHLDTILEKESDELIKSSVENLVPILSESEDFDDESLSDEDVPMENFKIYSNPLFDDEEIISPNNYPHYFNVESNLIESLLNHDILIDSSPKFDYLLKEFSGELAHIDPIPLGIEKADFDLEEETQLLNNDSLSLPENESSNLDHFNDPSPSRPPPEPPDVEICFDFKPDAGVVTNKVVGDIFEHDVLMPNLLPTQPTLCPVFDLLLLFSSENEDKVFNPGILISRLLSHWGEIISNFSKSQMMISGGVILYLDVLFLHFYPLDLAQVWGIKSGSRLGEQK